MADDLPTIMSRDLGIPRMPGEGETSSVCRVSYSALRFWVQAFCLDDGFGGSYGVAEATIIRKSAMWLRNLSGMYPGILNWYGSRDDMRGNLSRVVRMLADAGDLVRTSDGLYRCCARHTDSLGTRSPLILGLTDPTDASDARPISGMAFTSDDASPQQSAPITDTSPSAGGQAVFTLTEDGRHCIIELPRTLRRTARTSRFDLPTWPMSGIGDRRRRIARAEYAPMLAELLGGEYLTVSLQGWMRAG